MGVNMSVWLYWKANNKTKLEMIKNWLRIVCEIQKTEGVVVERVFKPVVQVWHLQKDKQ